MTPASSVEGLLRAATVRVEGGALPGAGFFVAPGRVMTCAHVVGDASELTVSWGGDRARARPVTVLRDRGRPIPVLADDYPDLAVLSVDTEDHPCVALDEDMPTTDDRFQTYGFPEEGGSIVLTPAMLTYRGLKAEHPTEFIDAAWDTVRGGMSGGALLNLRTKGVCGVLVATRNDKGAEGGFAVPWVAVRDALEAVIAANRAFHQQHHAWGRIARPEGRRVRFKLPLLVKHFSGRGPELESLERTLARDGFVTQAITGLGGVGKSQLAARYVRDHADEYDVVAWIRAEDGGVADLAELAVELGETVEGLSPDDRAGRAVGWLADCDERWLLVLDNVTTSEQLAICCPTAGNGHVLVTSRNREVGQFGELLDVDVFDSQAGEDYLVARTGREDEREAARRLTEALGGLPLALSHAGAYCSGTTSFDDYLSLLNELPAAEVFDASPEAFHAQTVGSTWQVSLEAAAAQAELAPAVLGMAAYLAPDHIPATLFEVLLDDATAARERKRLGDALNALQRLSLVEVEGARVNVHRLLQKTVRDDAAARGARAEVAAAARALRGAFPAEPDLPGWWPLCEELMPHVLALADEFVTSDVAEDVVALRHTACRYLLRAGGGERAVAIAEAEVGLAERFIGTERSETLAARADLANAHRSAGRADDAIQILEGVVADRERLQGAEDPATLHARVDLASAYWSAGRTADALELDERALADRERILGLEDPDTITARANLAVSYDTAGRTEEALVLLERALAERERILGGEHPDTIMARSNLAITYESVGRMDAALALKEQVLADRERILGAEHTDTAVARSNLAFAYERAGRVEEAIELKQRVLTDRERILGAEHPQTLWARSNLAIAYALAGRVAEALSLEEGVLADRERILGAEHPDTITARSNLAITYESVGRMEEALALKEQVLEGRERILGAEHLDTIGARSNLAIAYEWAGRLEEALALKERVLADRERILGAEHLDAIKARSNLAFTYESVGRLAEALALKEQVLADRERILGAEHPDTITARSNLAYTYESTGRVEEALALKERVLADRERVLGADHLDTISARADVAVGYRLAGRVAEALALKERVLADRERILGAEHPDTIMARSNLAIGYESVGRLEEAVAVKEQVLADRERILGAEHTDTAVARSNLAFAYERAGR
ncbi:MAG TPA: FxSxx-COOH system tetratricopeptide repeat protein, partial [Thermoleophilaceae bacterium]